MQTPNSTRIFVGCFYVMSLICFASSIGVVRANDSTGIELIKATPDSQGINGEELQQAVQKISDKLYGDIDSLLIVRNNLLVLEEYFSPLYHGESYKFPVRSVTKSISSALIGIAIEQGKIASTDQKLLSFFSEYSDVQNPDDRKQKITLEHVLTMTAGFQWNELSKGYADPLNDYNQMLQSEDGIKYVLDRPMQNLPGETLEYNGGGSYLLSSILEKATGLNAEEFAAEYLFKPAGIESWSWSTTPDGLINTAGSMSLTRRDMARFGILFLNKGRWDNKQIVPESWVEKSTAKYIDGKPRTFYDGFAYAMQWWRLHDDAPVVADLEVNDLYMAYGDGSQVIAVVPHLNTVIVSTGELHGADYALFFDLLRERIFPAIGR